jgi:Flp pilus assembly protein TadD
MARNLQKGRIIRFAISGVLAAALAACAGSDHLARAGSYAQQPGGAKASGKLDRTVASAEAAVLKNPGDAASRAALGGAYLDAGRFASAATTFQDAVALGDDSADTALRLALAQIGAGQGREAVVILDAHRDGIPAGDLGLALALAGETGRGVAVLEDAIRGGDNTAKLRQNLAYAYALDGRWREARLMAAQDVPADKLDERLGSWAVTGSPEDSGKRVAALLGAPVRPDAGQPVELALGNRPAAPTAPAQPQFAAAPAPSGELPPVDSPPSDPSREFAVAEPATPALPAEQPAAPSTGFATAFADAPRPVARAIPLRAARPAARPVAAIKPLHGGSHLVQLGSFSSPENARRAVTILKARHPQLKGFALTITPAVVHGKNFWRVAASGFSQASAAGMCSTLRTRGGACIAYSTYRPLPGAVPARGNGGPMMARR